MSKHAKPRRSLSKSKGLELIGLLILLTCLYLVNLSGWLMHDDEGTDFYEVWRYQLGERPGVDFAAEQQPLFLLAGGTLVELFGRSAFPLRLLAAGQVLLGALILAVCVRVLWGWRPATITLGLILLSGLVFEQGRLFRPDPMMLGWEMAALGLTLVAVLKGKNRYWALAGGFYGVAFLWKLFGVLPVIGLVFFFVDQLLRLRDQRSTIVISGMSFSIPYVLLAFGVPLLLYTLLGFYYGEIFQQHAGLRNDTRVWEQAINLLTAYAYLILVNAVFVLIVPLWILNKPQKWLEQPPVRLLFLQLLSPIVFILFSRPLYVRYLLFLIPVLAILLAWQMELMFQKLEEVGTNILFVGPPAILLLIVFTVTTTFPRLSGLLRTESGTMALAKYVAENTDPDDLVLSDYAGINFFAGRESIYEASIIAGGRLKDGVVTGLILITRIEEQNVKMVLVHVAGGEPPPHQLIDLVDYEDFRDYLKRKFVLVNTFNRAGQQIEIYVLSDSL